MLKLLPTCWMAAKNLVVLWLCVTGGCTPLPHPHPWDSMCVIGRSEASCHKPNHENVLHVQWMSSCHAFPSCSHHLCQPGILYLFRCLKLFQCWMISDSPLPQILWNFWQLNLAVSLLFRYLLFFVVVNLLCSVKGIQMLRVQGYQEIEINVMLGNDDFGWWMMTIWQANVMQMTHFSSCLEVKFGLLPFLKTVLHLSLSINLYSNFSMSYKCTWIFLE